MPIIDSNTCGNSLGGKPEARAESKPEAKLRLYVGGTVKAMLDRAPLPHGVRERGGSSAH
jgi:hypothetical protein